MTRFLLFLPSFAMIAFLVGPAYAQQARALPSCRVVACGVRDYVDPGIPDVNGADNDARKITQAFCRPLNRGQSQTLLVNEESTAIAIRAALKKTEEAVKPEDVVVVFLSGHGVRDGNCWYFLPHDSDLDDSPLGIADKVFLDTTLRLMERGNRVFLIIDCCHAGLVARSAERLLASEGKHSHRGGVALLAACAAHQQSRGQRSHGLFTQTVLAGLNSRADRNRDGMVTLEELVTYLGEAAPSRNLADQDWLYRSWGSMPKTLPLTRVSDAP